MVNAPTHSPWSTKRPTQLATYGPSVLAGRFVCDAFDALGISGNEAAVILGRDRQNISKWKGGRDHIGPMFSVRLGHLLTLKLRRVGEKSNEFDQLRKTVRNWREYWNGFEHQSAVSES